MWFRSFGKKLLGNNVWICFKPKDVGKNIRQIWMRRGKKIPPISKTEGIFKFDFLKVSISFSSTILLHFHVDMISLPRCFQEWFLHFCFAPNEDNSKPNTSSLFRNILHSKRWWQKLFLKIQIADRP